jgi:hypothetical protein
MKRNWKKWLLTLLAIGIIMGYTAFFTRAYSDYQESVRWADEQAAADKTETNASPNDTEPKPSSPAGSGLQNKELGKITGHDWAAISSDEKMKLVGTVLNGMRLTGKSIKASESELVPIIDSFYQDETRKNTDIVTAINYIGESQGIFN